LISAANTKNFFDARSTANHIFQGSSAVKDPEVADFIKNIFQDNLLDNGLNKWDNLSKFKNSFTNWLQTHQSNTVIGLDQYQMDFSAGTTQSFERWVSIGHYKSVSYRLQCEQILQPANLLVR
jgi:hypothetical protein